MTASLAEEKNPFWSFAITFGLVCVLSYAVFGCLPSEYYRPLNSYTADLVALALKTIGFHAKTSGDMVSVQGFSIRIIAECTALYVGILFTAFVVSYPARVKHKFLGIVFGIPVLVLFNLARLVILVIVGLRAPSLFEYVHVYFGQVLLILVTFFMCMIWVRNIVLGYQTKSVYVFVGKFLAIASLLFIPWVPVSKLYVTFNSTIVHYILMFFGYNFKMQMPFNVYPNTYNVIVFSALCVSSYLQNRRKLVWARYPVGLIVILVFDQFLMCLNALRYGIGVESAEIPLVAIQLFNQQLLPFLLWIVLVSGVRRDGPVDDGLVSCPFCSRKVKGLVQHVLAKHGPEYLESEEMKALLEAGEREPEMGRERVFGNIF